MSTPSIVRVTPETPVAEMEAVILRDGCIIIERLLSDAFVDRILDELAPWLDRTPEGSGEWVGFRTRRLHGLTPKSAAIRENICNPVILDLMQRLLGPWCDTFQLSSCSTTSIGPGEKAQELHRDDLMFPLTHPSERIPYCTTFWALSDFTEANGATHMIPGSHRWDDERKPRREETARAVMPKGSVVIYTGAVWHGGGANVTENEWRSALFTSYSVGWLKQEEAQFLVNPPEIARHYPERLQKLVGYQMHNPFLGWYDLQDPIEVLRGYEELSAPNRDLFAEGETSGVISRSVRRA